MSRTTWLVLAIVSGSAFPVRAQLSLQQVGTGFNQPLFLTAAPGTGKPNQVYVVEKGGLIRTLNTGNGAIGATPFLNLPSVLGAGQLLTSGEQGLLGMTFNPGFSNGDGFVFVNYVAANGVNNGGDTRIDRFTVVNGVVDTSSRVNILSFQQPSNQTNHKAGWIGFGQDNSLYIATGDGGGANDPDNLAQNLGSYLGKILRVNPSTTAGVGGYTIPSSNPFANNPNAVTQTIFAYGMRNPFRNSFDRLTGDLYIGDVGQNTREEIDFMLNGSPGGQNFGWRALEGSDDNPGVDDPPPPGAVPPIHDYTHASMGGSASVIGGYVYRGGNILDNGQNLDGTYIFGDFVTGRIFSFRYDGTTLTELRDRTAEMNSPALIGPFNLASFGEDSQGRLYAIDIGGQVWRITGSSKPRRGR